MSLDLVTIEDGSTSSMCKLKRDLVIVLLILAVLVVHEIMKQYNKINVTLSPLE